MIALVVALICARLLAGAFGAVLRLVLAAAGLVVELAYVVGRWVVWPVAVQSWRVVRRLTSGRARSSYPFRVMPPPKHRTRVPFVPPTCALAHQAAVLVGVRAARR